MKQLKTIIDSLNNDQLYAVRITDADTFKVICTNKTGQQMIDEFGSVEGFFNDLFASTQTVVIQPRRKNGSSYKDAGAPEKLSATPINTVHQAQVIPPTLPQQSQEGLTGLMGGLNAHETIYRHQDYPRLLAANQKLELENENLKEKIAQLKEEQLETKFSDSKAAGNKEMLSGLVETLAPVIVALTTKNASAVATAGLASPADTEAISPVKSNMVQAIKATSDQVNGYLMLTLQGINSIEGFGEELEELLIKHKLIPQQQ